MSDKKYKLGVIYGTDPETEMLAKKFVGNLINDEEFCKACELLEQKVKCDHCRENLESQANSIYYYEKVGVNVPDFIEEPQEYLPKNLPAVDFLLVVGIHQDLLSGLPEYLKDTNLLAVIVPIENPKWIPPGLQVQVLEEFEKVGIQAAFPKPFCALSKELNEYNVKGFNITHERDQIINFIDYFKIGEPIVAFLLTKDGKAVEDTCVIQTAPCGSTYFILQQLHGKYINDDKTSLNEKISKAHHSYPCNASMDQDSVLKESILHIGGYLIRNEIRRKLNLPIKEEQKLVYVIR
ncbi:MAG: hypothetical protein EU533_02125 [Promethearchaeota archaeon]|nr:MAG: hypothetical protein EU533_02125 [Candidatus Lokiarchaeota archaeon]